MAEAVADRFRANEEASSLLYPFVGRGSKFLHRENHGLTSVRRKQADDVLVNGDIHESELVAGLDAFRSQLDFNNPAVPPSGALSYDSLGDESINNPRETATG